MATTATKRRAPDTCATRVTLTRAELLHLKDFAANVDDPDHDAWWDQLANKLERAIARIDGGEPVIRKTSRVAWEPDQRAAICRSCGWEGTVTKTGPCPSCGARVNPLLFDGRRRT